MNAELPPLDRVADEMLRFDNRERYIRQHAATEAGKPAPLPPRLSLADVDAKFAAMFGARP